MDILQLKALMADPLWRLCHLYRIIPGTGGDPVPFRPRPEQLALFKFLLEEEQGNAVIVKSRRLGFSTSKRQMPSLPEPRQSWRATSLTRKS